MAADLKDLKDEQAASKDARLDNLKGGDPIPPMRADDHSSADPAVETPVEARQGFLGRPVLVVLIGGLALAIIAWVLVDLLAY